MKLAIISTKTTASGPGCSRSTTNASLVVPDHRHVLLFCRRRVRRLIHPRIAHSPGRLVPIGNLQPSFHHAWRRHDILLPHPGHPRHAGQFPGAAHGRRARSGLSTHQPAQLVPPRHRRQLDLFAAIFGGVDTGWTFYTPCSSTYSNSWVLVTVGIFVSGFSSILTGLNFIVTIQTMRAPGLTWFRVSPVHLVALRNQSMIMVLGTPVVAVTLLLVGMERRLARRHRRLRARRRPDSLPASVLVLFAPGGLHHDPPRHGA